MVKTQQEVNHLLNTYLQKLPLQLLKSRLQNQSAQPWGTEGKKLLKSFSYIKACGCGQASKLTIQPVFNEIQHMLNPSFNTSCWQEHVGKAE